MGQLDIILDKITGLSAEAKVIGKREDVKKNSDIMALRENFVGKISDLMEHMETDSRLLANPKLHDEFKERVSSFRRTVAMEHAKWRIVNIEADPEGYLHAAQALDVEISNTMAWAKSALRTA